MAIAAFAPRFCSIINNHFTLMEIYSIIQVNTD